MRKKLTIELDENEAAALEALAAALGFSPENAAVYAVRLTGACVREGLIGDVPARAWPKEADGLLRARGKVIDFPHAMRMPAEK